MLTERFAVTFENNTSFCQQVPEGQNTIKHHQHMTYKQKTSSLYRLGSTACVFYDFHKWSYKKSAECRLEYLGLDNLQERVTSRSQKNRNPLTPQKRPVGFKSRYVCGWQGDGMTSQRLPSSETLSRVFQALPGIFFNTINKSAGLGQDVKKHITLLPELRIGALEQLHGKS